MIVIIPIKKLIIGAGAPPADPIMGWFSSPRPFIPFFPSLLSLQVRLQIWFNLPHSPVVKAVAQLDSVLPVVAYENTSSIHV